MLKLISILPFVFAGVFSFAQTDTTAHGKKVKPVPPWWVERFSVSAGIFVPLSNTVVKVGSEDGSFGTSIDLEDDLGFTESTISFFASAEWRASRRSKFSLNYFDISRKATHTILKDIEFKDTTYHANASVHASAQAAIFQFSYGYAFLLNPRYEAGLTIGVHIIANKFGLGLANNVNSLSKETDYDFTAPLPDLGIWGGYGISDKWAVRAAFNYLSLTVGDINGRILSYNAGITYYIFKNLSASVSYAGLDINVDVEKDIFQGYFKWGYKGPSFTLNYAFGKNKWHQ